MGFFLGGGGTQSCKLYTFGNLFAWHFSLSDCSLFDYLQWSNGQTKVAVNGLHRWGPPEPGWGLEVGNPNGLSSCPKQTWSTCQALVSAPLHFKEAGMGRKLPLWVVPWSLMGQ